MASPEPEPAQQPKKKRLPFKRMAPRLTPADEAADGNNDEQDDLDFFRRTKDIIPLVLEEMKETKRNSTPEKKPSLDKNGALLGSFVASPDKRERKRIKMSPGSESDRDNRLRTPSSSSQRAAGVPLDDDSDSDLIMDVKGKGKEIIYRTPAKRKLSNPQASRAPDLPFPESDEDVKPRKKHTPQKGRPPPPVVDLSSDDDEDYDDVKPMSAYLDKDSEKDGDKDSDKDSDIQELVSPPLDEASEELQYWIQQAKALEEKNQDVTVDIIVTSRIAGIKPLRIRRRVNQIIRPVVWTWIDRQRAEGFDVPADVANTIFLTWKGHKVYNSSTIQSLGIQVDPETGTVKPGRDGGFRSGMLQFEVWTEAAYADHLRMAEHERKEQLGIYDEGEDEDAAANPAAADEVAAAKEMEGQYKVRLKSQTDAILCKISSTYTVKEVVECFREVSKIGADRAISIWVDGEQLDEDALAVDAAELDPDEINQLEVHIK